VYEVAVDGSRSYFNRRWSEYTGQNPDSLAERSESVHPEDRPRFLATWAQAVHQAAPFECRYRLRRYDGEYRWFLSRAFPVCASAGRPLRWFGTATDVHDLTASQEALREEEALLRAIIDTIAEPVYVKDAQSRLILVNAATLELLGKTREELLGRTERDFYQDAAAGQAILEHDGQVMTSGTVQTFEETVVTPNGLRIMLNTKAPRRDASGRIVGLVGVARDITELKRAEEERARISREIDEQRGRLQTIVDSLPVGLWITDHMGRMLVINDQARAIWGGEAPAAHTIQDYAVYRVWEGDSDQPLAAQDMPIARALRGEVCRDMILDFQRFNGSRGTQLVAASPVKAPDGRISGAVAVFQDITERRRMEAALLEADRHKNEFLAMLSHELRNPLAPIVNSLYILDHAAPDGEQASRAKQVIGRQVAQLSNLVNDLLDVTRIVRNKIRLQKERLELNELVGRAVEDNRSLFEAADVRLELALARRRVPIVADRTRIAQVVGNLLQNAAKFTPKGGCTRVSVSVAGFTAVLCVADDGVGMAPETLATLFVPFTQADRTLDRSKGGLGLGLALVKALVEMHEGAVSAHSNGLGKGTAFEVRLPLDLRTTTDTAAIQGRATGLRRRILIIEDNLDAADSLREALELSGHEVAIANDGPDGLAKARRHKPDAVFCDIGLPGMDGFAVARTLRADQGLKETFLVALSGYALPEDMQRSLEAGFQHHLAKPPSLDKLEQLLASLPPRVVGD
jgi:PAS domain S-box-containing protein